MDSLLCRISSLRVWVPVSAVQPCDTTGEAFQSAPRSVQGCTCRSPGLTPLRGVPVMSSASPTEEATSKDRASAPTFNPLPLLLSHSANVPEPLKFLWYFNRKELEGTDQDSPASTSAAGNKEETRLSSGDYHRKECHEEGLDKAEGPSSEQEDCNDGHVLLEQSEQGDADEDNDGKSSLSETHVVGHEGSRLNAPALPPLRDWVEKMAALWPDPNYFRTRSAPTRMTSTTEAIDVSSVPKTDDTFLAPKSSEGDSSYSACSVDTVDGCALEVPYSKVLHTRDSFSEYLQEASLLDMRVFAQLAFLCDMAYTIPDIQAAELMKFHRLKLVISSLDKKAEAEVKVKESELLKKLGANGTGTTNGTASNGCVNLHSDTSLVHNSNKSQTFPEKPSNPGADYGLSHLAAAPQVSSLSEESGASFISNIDSSSCPKQSSSILTKLHSSCVMEKLEGHAGMDQDAIMAIAPATVAAVLDEKTKLEDAKDFSSMRHCPCEWFVCDEESNHTRMFIIQGSESLASWQTNLFFEPTPFEGLDVFVHRGIYEAAKALYDQMLPEVLAHFSRHGYSAHVRFTGHSLGGSLAVLLALMFQLRGVLPRTAILPVVTFGSPFIMCGGDYLLRKMQLPPNHIQSVIMHRDVVPRAFACDYLDHVAEVLKRLNGKFRDHPCLNNQKLLYSPMGELYILQPDASAAPFHPLLPDGDGLYALRHPLSGDDLEKTIALRGAQRAFLNMPHPLDILADPGAYGFDGTVSRDHDPRGYSKAIHAVLKHRARTMRHKQREQRRQLIWPALTRGTSVSQTQPPLGMMQDSRVNRGALTSAVSCVSVAFKQHLHRRASNHIGSPVYRNSFWTSYRGSVTRRYARVIASQHVQMGMLLVLSLRLVIMECLSSLLLCA